jgi:hypothetical protein
MVSSLGDKHYKVVIGMIRYGCLWSREQHAVADDGPLMGITSTSVQSH